MQYEKLKTEMKSLLEIVNMCPTALQEIVLSNPKFSVTEKDANDS